jgi:hypothetical protein
MATSYKTMWQEANQEVERLKSEIQQLRQSHRAETEKLYSYIESHRSDLAQTRQIVDLAGIARHMRVERFTPQQWKQRDLLPPVDFPEIREPLWYASTIRDGFVVPTGRVWYDHPEQELSPAA